MSNAPHTACEHRIGDDALLVIVLDKVGRFVYANPAYQAASGYTWEELAGTNASKMMHGDVPVALSQDMAATLGVATLDYLPYALFNLVNPVLAGIFAYAGFKILRLEPQAVVARRERS